jgi:hypothetical protein
LAFPTEVLFFLEALASAESFFGFGESDRDFVVFILTPEYAVEAQI